MQDESFKEAVARFERALYDCRVNPSFDTIQSLCLASRVAWSVAFSEWTMDAEGDRESLQAFAEGLNAAVECGNEVAAGVGESHEATAVIRHCVESFRYRLEMVTRLLQGDSVDVVLDSLTHLQSIDARSTEGDGNDELSSRSPETPAALQKLAQSLSIVALELAREFGPFRNAIPSHASVIEQLRDRGRILLEQQSAGEFSEETVAVLRHVISRLELISNELRACILSPSKSSEARASEVLWRASSLIKECRDVLTRGTANIPEAELSVGQESLSTEEASEDDDQAHETDQTGSTVGPPQVIFVWDPELVSSEDYSDLFLAVGDLVRAHGGKGLKVLEEQQFGVAAKGARV